MTDPVLVVAAHPDDEVLGCGATIAKHARAGQSVHVLILAEGLTSRGARPSRNAAANTALRALRRAARTAASALGVSSVTMAGLPDNRLDGLELLDVVKVVERSVEAVRPGTVYTHHCGDVNVDHRIAHEAVLAAVRPQPGHPVRRLYFFEVPSSTEWRPPGSLAPFQPNHFVDVADSLAAKREALGAYASEMRPWPHPRSFEGVEALARWRGASAGFTAAEAFAVGRSLA